jgi:hypothetical protein
MYNGKSSFGIRGVCKRPHLGKVFEIDHENLLHRKKSSKLTENPGFFRK